MRVALGSLLINDVGECCYSCQGSGGDVVKAERVPIRRRAKRTSNIHASTGHTRDNDSVELLADSRGYWKVS